MPDRLHACCPGLIDKREPSISVIGLFNQGIVGRKPLRSDIAPTTSEANPEAPRLCPKAPLTA